MAEGTLIHRLRSYKVLLTGFRTGVQLPSTPPKSANPNVERCSDFAYSAPPAQYDPNLILWEGIRIVVFIYFARRLAERKAWSAGKAAMADEIRRNRAAASGLVFIHPEKCAVIR